MNLKKILLSSDFKYIRFPKRFEFRISFNIISLFGISFYPSLFVISFLIFHFVFWYESEKQNEFKIKQMKVDFLSETREKLEKILIANQKKLKKELYAKELYFSGGSFNFTDIDKGIREEEGYKLITEIFFHCEFELDNKKIPKELREWLKKTYKS